MTNDGEDLYRFAIAGADKKFVWANAKIEGDKVVVWSDEIATQSMYDMPGLIILRALIYITKKVCLHRLLERMLVNSK